MLADGQDHRKEAAQPRLSGTESEDGMGEYNTCSKCVYWVHGVCQATKERKNDTVCTCGMFKKREENK